MSQFVLVLCIKLKLINRIVININKCIIYVTECLSIIITLKYESRLIYVDYLISIALLFDTSGHKLIFWLFNSMSHQNYFDLIFKILKPCFECLKTNIFQIICSVQIVKYACRYTLNIFHHMYLKEFSFVFCS